MLKHLFILFILGASTILAQNPLVQFSDTITKNANAVVQKDDCTVNIISQTEQVIDYNTVVTVLNNKADWLGDMTIYYNKYTKITNLKVAYYNASGKLLKKVKRKDFNDYSTTGNASLYTDSRAIHYNYIPKEYPYTIAYEYKITTSNTAFIRPWYPIRSYNISVIQSAYTIQAAPDLKLNFLETNFNHFAIDKKTINTGFKYSLSHAKALRSEPLAPSFDKIAPHVRFAVDQFQLAGVKGNATTWKAFGKWMNDKLLASRNNLNQATKDKIKSLVKGVSDPIDRAKIIYDYVQNKTRYISVQIGIGGWMPMLTDDVDKLGYGDCKALTYYTKSLLDVAEVPSYYSILYAGNDKRNINKDIVAVQGNHAFLCLPTAKDTVWLECTSQRTPFGYINSFSDDRDVLVVTKNGGEIRHTSTNTSAQNLQKMHLAYTLTNNGTIKGDVQVQNYGTKYKEHLFAFDAKNPRELDRALKNIYDLNAVHFSNVRVTNNKKMKRYDETFSFEAPNYMMQYTSDMLVFNPIPFNRLRDVPTKITTRTLPFVISRGFQNTADYTILLPSEYKLEKTPKNVHFETQFGQYTKTYTYQKGKLYVKRVFILNKGFYPKEAYEAYRLFRIKINKLESSKIILNKKS